MTLMIAFLLLRSVQKSRLASKRLDVKHRLLDDADLSTCTTEISDLLDADAFDKDAFRMSRIYHAMRNVGPVCLENERLWIYIMVSQMLPRFTWSACATALCGDEGTSSFENRMESFLKAFLLQTSDRRRTFYLLLRKSFSRTIALTNAASALLGSATLTDSHLSQIWLGKSSSKLCF